MDVHEGPCPPFQLAWGGPTIRPNWMQGREVEQQEVAVRSLDLTFGARGRSSG